jgi:hypothetical protein
MSAGVTARDGVVRASTNSSMVAPGLVVLAVQAAGVVPAAAPRGRRWW